MSDSLVRSVARIWRDSPTLRALVPFERVFTGRIPQTELVDFPYVSILTGPGRQWSRSDKARYSYAPLSFHIWTNEDQLETAVEDICRAISDTYAERCWPLTANDASDNDCYSTGIDQVIDVLDEGEPIQHQPAPPTIKAWEVVKLFTVCLERARVDRHEECCDATFSEESGSELWSGQ